jgi:hypothetical protein
MRKALLSLTFLLGIIIFVNAQIEIKPTIGMNFSKLNDEPENFSQSARVGYQLGGSVQIGKKLYFEPGIFWTKLGSEMVHANQSNLDFTTDINAIRIPAFVGYQIIGGDEENIFGLRVFGGPTGSWVTKVSANDTDLDKEDFNSFLWGADVGAGIDVWLLFLDMGYEWGLNDVFKDDPNHGKNRAWWVNLGVRIRIGK